ncbi:hypothetical protein C5Y97_15910 [Blastopirellula marina]|uniref:Uncharacterized protein n=2 Tax=Blastopirellula marina TaxID=124 RepID=A0A2S8FNE6_9BACT|nr:hypothetical protein C5Y98_15900 [Blastopirellula marina]PTL43502.1 hypothetical protein C5Y97_15910 [Blastopirellula marina]
MLLLQTVCLAQPIACSCSQSFNALATCQCCCADRIKPASPGCPHCHHQSAPRPRDESESLHADGTCHCHLTAPESDVSVFNLENVETVATAMPALDTTVTSFVVVCNPETSAPSSILLPLPDTSFRRILLCVWLT